MYQNKSNCLETRSTKNPTDFGKEGALFEFLNITAFWNNNRMNSYSLS